MRIWVLSQLTFCHDIVSSVSSSWRQGHRASKSYQNSSCRCCATIRETVGGLTLQRRAISAPDLRPVITLSAISRRLAASSFFRRPPILPSTRAAARPADVRSRIDPTADCPSNDSCGVHQVGDLHLPPPLPRRRVRAALCHGTRGIVDQQCAHHQGKSLTIAVRIAVWHPMPRNFYGAMVPVSSRKASSSPQPGPCICHPGTLAARPQGSGAIKSRRPVRISSRLCENSPATDSGAAGRCVRIFP